LCKDWRDAINIYLSNFRDIQFHVPSFNLNERDIKALNSNLDNIQGHSKWILQILKNGMVPITNCRIKSCKEMMYYHECTESLNIYDAIIILNTPGYNNEVKLYALEILEHENISHDLATFLPIEDPLIQDLILKRNDLFLNFFWLSRINNGLIADIF